MTWSVENCMIGGNSEARWVLSFPGVWLVVTVSHIGCLTFRYYRYN